MQDTTNPTTFKVHCPCGCGKPVDAVDLGFDSTQVAVTPCDECLLGTMHIRKSWAYSQAVQVTTTVTRHRDGLVSFG